VKITRNFHDWEVTFTDSGIQNEAKLSDWVRATALACNVLQPLRGEAGPLHVTSWYRSPSLNKHVGGSPDSQHKRGEAADIFSPRYEPAGLAILAYNMGLPVDQCIIYPDHGFVHFSHVATKRGRNEFFIERGGNHVPWSP